MNTHTKKITCCADHSHSESRRSMLKMALGFGITSTIAGVGLATPNISYAAALTKEQRDLLTPEQIIEEMKQGNERFRTGKSLRHDYVAQKQATVAGQYPSAAILSCIDSRTPAEILLDSRLGDAFNGRIAGNIVNPDLIGSLEFACAVAGAKVIVIMGHTACGAVRGAIDNVKLGSLTGLLKRIQPAVTATKYAGQRTGNNPEFVDAVAKTNALLGIDLIRKHSEILRNLEKTGKLKIVAAMYYLDGGRVEFL